MCVRNVHIHTHTNVYLYKDSGELCSMYWFSYFLQGLEFIQQNAEKIYAVIVFQFQINLVPNNAVTRREEDVLSFCGFFHLSSYKKLLKQAGSQSPFGDHGHN